MPTTRRQFIKRGAGMVSLSMLMPRILLSEARGQEPAAFNSRKFVVLQFNGGNDGLNTVIPYSESRYQQLRPTLHFKDSELKDAQGNTTIISGELGLHPAMSEIKSLYDAGQVAIINGIGYQNSSQSHFLGTDIWMTANPNGGSGLGWLGKYADQFYYGKSSLSAISITGTLPKAFYSDKFVTPNVSNYNSYTFQTDARNPGDRNNQLNTFRANGSRSFGSNTFLDVLNDMGLESVNGASALTTAVAGYNSSVTYPNITGNPINPLSLAFRMLAQAMTTVPDLNLGYLQIGGFDTHSLQIGSPAEPGNKLIGQHATLLRYFSQAVKAFLDDMAEHGMNDVVIMTFSEFGRRPNENASFGCDHGAAAPLFVIGKPVKGGLYGDYPPLSTTGLDGNGNLRYSIDFRRVYATMLDKWLGADSQTILGGRYETLDLIQ